jgi:hypothetical protein
VIFVGIEASTERIASITSAERIIEMETTLAVTNSNCQLLLKPNIFPGSMSLST